MSGDFLMGAIVGNWYGSTSGSSFDHSSPRRYSPPYLYNLPPSPAPDLAELALRVALDEIKCACGPTIDLRALADDDVRRLIVADVAKSLSERFPNGLYWVED